MDSEKILRSAFIHLQALILTAAILIWVIKYDREYLCPLAENGRLAQAYLPSLAFSDQMIQQIFFGRERFAQSLIKLMGTFILLLIPILILLLVVMVKALDFPRNSKRFIQ